MPCSVDLALLCSNELAIEGGCPITSTQTPLRLGELTLRPPGIEAELTPTSHLVLGMVRLGFDSGYAIRNAVDLSAHAFWPLSLAQIYPELARLQAAGHLSRRSNPRGAQARSAFTLTAAGAAAFSAWLRSTETETMQIRDEGLLRLYFADILPRAGRLELIGHIGDNERDSSERIGALASFRAPAAPGPMQYPELVAGYGVACYAFSARWMGRLRTRVEAGTAGEPLAENGSATAPRRPVSPPRSVPPLRLTMTSHLILAMVNSGARYGYAIRRAAEETTQAIWPTSFANLYPQLTRLTEAGLLAKRSDPNGRRARSAYSITDQGRAALCAWLRSPRLAPTRLRHELLLRLFFADALSPSDQLELVRNYRNFSQLIADAIREQRLPLTKGRQDFKAIVPHYAHDKFAYSARWLGRLQDRLESGELAPQGHNGSH